VAEAAAICALGVVAGFVYLRRNARRLIPDAPVAEPLEQAPATAQSEPEPLPAPAVAGK